jgi:hypothetical protein
MPGLVPGIHDSLPDRLKTLDGRDEPAMTVPFTWKDNA